MEEQLGRMLWDALWCKTVWPFTSDIRFFAMHYFGGYPIGIALALVTLGATISASINYGAGRLFYDFQRMGITTLSDAKFTKWQERFSLLIIPIGLLSWYHLFGALVLAAGFFRVPFWSRMLPSLLVGQLIYYGYYVFG